MSRAEILRLLGPPLSEDLAGSLDDLGVINLHDAIVYRLGHSFVRGWDDAYLKIYIDAEGRVISSIVDGQ